MKANKSCTNLLGANKIAGTEVFRDELQLGEQEFYYALCWQYSLYAWNRRMLQNVECLNIRFVSFRCKWSNKLCVEYAGCSLLVLLSMQ